MARTEIRGGQIQDESITEADIKDGSIKAAELAPEAITGQTLHSGTVDDVNDMMLIYDASTTALRKIPVGDLAGGGGGGTPTLIEDTDQDTKITVEASADEDYIRFRTAGLERMVIDNVGNVSMDNDLQVIGQIKCETLKAVNDITLDANGGQIFMKDNGITYLTFNVDGTTDSIDAVGHLKLNASADVYINAQQGDIFFQDNGTTRMRIEDTTGDISIGMGDTGPVYRLDVHDNTASFVMNIENDYTSAGADLLRMQVSILNPSSSSALIYIYDSSNTGIYAVQGNGSGGSTVTTSFTAGHDTVIQQSTDVVPGMIVESTGESWYKPTLATFETALPKVRLSDTNGSKKVFGVVAGFPEAEGDEEGWQHNGYTMRPAFPKYGQIAGIDSTEWNIGTMSIGEGCIWITNINGEIQNGDLIESSVILGHGRLQDDDIMRSKTVAKCTEDIDWNSVTETIDHEGVTYKKFLASCTFHCG